MKSIIRTKNKRGLSEIVAYVMLIVMSLSLASGIYVWLKTNVPADKETCSEDVSISIKSYTCDIINHKINLTVENKGYFSIAGFFIRGSNLTTNLPIVLLAQEDPATVRGRYNFKVSLDGKLAPGKTETMTFKYDYPEQNYSILPLARIQLQPFIIGVKSKTILLCDKGIASQEIINCN